MRVHQLAQELREDSRVVIRQAKALGIVVRSASSPISVEDARRVSILINHKKKHQGETA
jgi:hypothetical protein